MKTTKTIWQMDDAELSLKFAKTIVGWSMRKTNPNDPILGPMKRVLCAPGVAWDMNMPSYATSLDATMPFLSMYGCEFSIKGGHVPGAPHGVDENADGQAWTEDGFTLTVTEHDDYLDDEEEPPIVHAEGGDNLARLICVCLLYVHHSQQILSDLDEMLGPE